MKIILVLALVSFSTLIYFKSNNVSASQEPYNLNSQNEKTKNDNSQKYQCDGRQHCSQMKSCEEAKYFIKNCPNTKMDGDNDGIPCERQFCGY